MGNNLFAAIWLYFLNLYMVAYFRPTWLVSFSSELTCLYDVAGYLCLPTLNCRNSKKARGRMIRRPSSLYLSVCYFNLKLENMYQNDRRYFIIFLQYGIFKFWFFKIVTQMLYCGFIGSLGRTVHHIVIRFSITKIRRCTPQFITFFTHL